MKHVIIGNGPTGLVAAETLRRLQPDAEIALIGDEKEPPYSRMAIPYFLHGNIGEAVTLCGFGTNQCTRCSGVVQHMYRTSRGALTTRSSTRSTSGSR